MKKWNQSKRGDIMNNKNIILIVILIVVIIVAIGGVAIGFTFYKNNNNNAEPKEVDTFNLTLEDMYCNIKDSKKIVKVRVTVETNNERTLELLKGNQFLIRDDINKIIRNKEEENLEGEEGQVLLQKQIKDSLVDLFDKETVTNVYFNDLIIQ